MLESTLNRLFWTRSSIVARDSLVQPRFKTLSILLMAGWTKITGHKVKYVQTFCWASKGRLEWRAVPDHQEGVWPNEWLLILRPHWKWRLEVDSRAVDRTSQFSENFCGGKPALLFVMSNYDYLETKFWNLVGLTRRKLSTFESLFQSQSQFRWMCIISIHIFRLVVWQYMTSSAIRATNTPETVRFKAFMYMDAHTTWWLSWKTVEWGRKVPH